MKKLILFLSLIVCCHPAHCQLPAPSKVTDKVSLRFHKNVELLGFAYFIRFEATNSQTRQVEVNGQSMLEKDWQTYGFHLYQKYSSFATSKNLEKALSVADHLWLDYLISLLIQVDDFPNAHISAAIDPDAYLRFSQTKQPDEALKNVSTFLDGCNAFYKEVNFDQYLNEYTSHYHVAARQIRPNLPSPEFITYLEDFYRQSFETYTLVPSLTLPKGMGFGPRYTRNNQTHVFSVFGAFDSQQFTVLQPVDMGFNNPKKARELSIHEFGHSFVNPVVYQMPSELIEETHSLFTPIQAVMNEQGYNTWQACLIEHLVRAGEISIAQQMKLIPEANRLKTDYQQNRKFIYLPIFMDELASYSSDQSYSYSDVVKRCLQRLKEQMLSADTTQFFSTNPRDVVFHTEDITNFWKIFDQSYPKISGKQMQTEYIDKGSSGLQGFLKNRIENGRLLSKTVRSQLSYYESVRPYTLSIAQKTERLYECFENLKKLYPKAIFPDVYFVIGRNNTGGTIFDKGLVIGAERFGQPNGKFQPALAIDDIDEIISHELIHFQQKYVKDHTLVAQCIREGSADFIGELISGSVSSNKAMYAYGDQNRVLLWKEFSSRMHQNDWSNWLYFQKDKSRPKDLGYWMGYQICRSYYERATDKKQAITDILTITDFKAFLDQSGYTGQ